MNTKALFPSGGGSNLILGIGRENQIFILKTPAAIEFFPENSQKWSLWCKKIITTQMDLYGPYMVPHTIS